MRKGKAIGRIFVIVMICLVVMLTLGQIGSAVSSLDNDHLHQLPATSGKISYFASDDGHPGVCHPGAWGELLGERCGTDDVTKYWYCAMRWPYAEWDSELGKPVMKSSSAKNWWHNKKIRVSNPKNGKQVILTAKDWGPNPGTGRAIDVSYTALNALGAKTDEVVYIVFADQTAPLGPVAASSSSTSGEVVWAEAMVGRDCWYSPKGCSNEGKCFDSSGWCARFVANAYRACYAGGHAIDLWTEAEKHLEPLTNAPVGAIACWDKTSSNKHGHVGLHVGGGKVVHGGFSQVREDYYAKVDEVGGAYVGEYLGWFYPPSRWPGRPDPSQKFKVGDKVKTASSLKVRSGPGVYYIEKASEPRGASGQVLAESVYADEYYWWKICYDDGVVGWSIQNGLELDGVSELTADLNCDGKVDSSDSGILMSYWGTDGSGATSCRSPDINRDGIVDSLDLNILKSQWTQPNEAPVARITMTSGSETAYEDDVLKLTVPSGGTANVHFSASRSSDPDGLISSYQWLINGQPAGNKCDFDSDDLSEGTYDIFLTVTDNEGAEDSIGASIIITSEITAENEPPIARITMTTGSETAYENQVLELTVPSGGTAKVDFSASRSSDPDGSISSYKWYIGGTFVSSSRDFSYNLGEGTCDIFLTVKDNNDATGSVGATVKITR